MASKREQKVVRVFISSTFKEFETERRILAGSVFPNLRERFSTRGISIVAVDLRWGLESSQIEKSGLVDACLGQVIECNPYFLGLLGSRYGTVVSSEELNASRLLKSHLVEKSLDCQTSITELEFQIGALQDHNEYALFFSKGAPECRDQGTASLLEKVFACGAVPLGYDTFEHFESIVFEKLVDLIERRFPEGVDELSPEIAAQEAILGQHIDFYVPGSPVVEEALSRLRDGKSIYLLGEKGVGKSAALSYCVNRLTHDGEGCFLYFCNTGYCFEDIAILRRIASYLESEYGAAFGLNEADDFGSVVGKLAAGASKIKLDKPVYIFVDAIEQLKSRRNLWLAISSICEQNAMLACMLTGTQSLAGDDELVLLGLERAQIEGVVNRELADAGRTLRAPLLEKLMSCDIARNPVALRGALNELSVVGKYDELDAFVDKLCSCSDVSSLFDSILERVIGDAAVLGLSPESIRRAAVFIANVHYGASEDEIMSVSGLLPLGWAMLRAALAPFLVSFDGRIRFNHQLAENAVKAKQRADTLATVTAAALKEYASYPRSIARVVELSGWAFLSDDDRVIASVVFDPEMYPTLVDHDEDGLRRSLSRLSRNEESISDDLARLTYGRAGDLPFLLELCALLSKTGCVRSCIAQVEFAQAQGRVNADMLTLKARAMYQRGDYANVQGAFDEALRAMSAEHRCDTTSYALLMLQYGIAEKSCGRGRSALAKAREACAVFDRLGVASSDSLWCRIYRATLEFSYACGAGPDTFSEILMGQKLLSGERSYAYSRLLCYSWQSFLLAGDYEAADAMTKQSLEGLLRTSGEGPDSAWALTNRATVLACLGKGAESKACSMYSDKLNGQTATGDRHVYSITSRMNGILLDFVERIGSDDGENAALEAIGALERLRVIALGFHGERHPYVLNIEANKALLSAEKSVDELCDVSGRLACALEGDNSDSLYLDACAWALGGCIDRIQLVERYKRLGMVDHVTKDLLDGRRSAEFRLAVNNGAALYLVPNLSRP